MENENGRKNNGFEHTKEQCADLTECEKEIEIKIGTLILILSVIAAAFSFLPVFFDYFDQKASLSLFVIILVFAFIFIVLAIIIYSKYKSIVAIRKRLRVSKREYDAEIKKNKILDSVFESLREVNSEKIRRTLRITYGSVCEWNPMNYKVNRLVYDVHDQIRSILIALQKVVISIDPDRFSDKNVSVDLVWCYPEDDGVESDLPLLSRKTDGEVEHRWKLISSGDFSGNHTRVLDYLKDPCSFYTLLSCFGSWFANNKYKIHLQPEENRLFRRYLERHVRHHDSTDTSTIFTAINSKTFFIENVKDFENTKMRKKQTEDHNGEFFDGSVAGEVICVRNDNPEHILVKALLTINTYGEPIHVGPAIAEPSKPIGERSPDSADDTIPTHSAESTQESDSKSNDSCSSFDKFGLTEYDYEDLFMNQIIPTYSNLLASEMSQMYIRHRLNEGKLSPFTGMRIPPDS